MAVQIIDDRTPSPALQYSEAWQLSASSYAYNSTVSWTTAADASVRLTFQVNEQIGALSVYGVVMPKTPDLGPPHSGYSLDGRPLDFFNATETNSAQYNQLFYRSPLLNIGEHSMVITNLLPSSALYIDYFVVAPPDYQGPSLRTPPSTSRSVNTTDVQLRTSPASTTSTSLYINITQVAPIPIASTVTVTASTNSSSSAISSTTTDATSITTPTLSTETKDPTFKVTSTMKIVGIAVGAGIVFIVLLGIFFIWLRRRRKKPPPNANVISSFQIDTQLSTSYGALRAVPTRARPLSSSYLSSYSSQTSESRMQLVNSSSEDSHAPIFPARGQHTPYNHINLQSSYGNDTQSVLDYETTSPPDYTYTDPPSYVQPYTSPASQSIGPSKLRAEFSN